MQCWERDEANGQDWNWEPYCIWYHEEKKANAKE